MFFLTMTFNLTKYNAENNVVYNVEYIYVYVVQEEKTFRLVDNKR